MMQTIRASLITGSMMLVILLLWCGTAPAVGLRVVPSVTQTAPGQDIYVDIVAEGIPGPGLNGFQFRLSATSSGGPVTGVDDLNQAGTTGLSISTPLLISPATSTRAGLGDFFWNGRGPSGILAMDNERLVNGAALFTLAHTSGATPPSGSGTVARFPVRVGQGVSGKIDFGLSDVLLMDTEAAYPSVNFTGASVTIQCLAVVPSLLGLTQTEATGALTAANLVVGTISETPNPTGSLPLRVVLSQSVTSSSSAACGTSVSLAINIPPEEVTALTAADKGGANTGVLHLTWVPSVSADVAGYRVYQQGSLLAEVKNPTATGTDIAGLPAGISRLYRVTAFDTFNNESLGVTASATLQDPDIIPPTGSISINDSAVYTMSSTDTLTLSATDPAGVAGMCLSNSAVCSSWENLVPTKNWTLSSGDGLKSVNVWYKDGKGNVTAAPYSATITLDTTKPVVKYFALPKGEYPGNVARSIVVPVTLAATDTIKLADYCLIESTDPAACSWTPTAPTLHTFGSFGPHTLYAFARDAAGNISTPVSATVTVVPTATLKVVLNGTGGGSVTGPVAGITCSAPPLAGVCAADVPVNTSVTLNAAPTGSALFSGWGGACTGTGICTLKLTGNLTAAAFFASPQTVRLSCITPPKYFVSLQQAYNEAPDGCVIQSLAGILRESLALDKDKKVTIKGGYDPAYSKIVGTTGLTGTLALIKGTAILENLVLTGTAAQAPDATSPVGTITINQGAATTASPLVSIELKAADPGGVTGQCLSNTADCSVWEPYAGTPLPWLLPEGDGLKTVNAWFKDSAGNITSQPISASIVLDMTPPVVQKFTLPEGDYPLNITLPITVPVVLAASDNLKLDGVCLTEAGVSTSCAWTPTLPDKFTFGSYGPHTLYAFARDAAGNITEPLAMSVTILPTAGLTVEISGTGGGSVTSVPAGITCTYPPVNAVCIAEFPFNSSVSLLSAPNGDSILTTWGGTCSGSGACSVKMTGNLGVNATLTTVEPVQLACTTPPKRYTLLQQAYDEAPNGCLIQVRATTLMGDLALTANKSVTIRGGYDTSFAKIIGRTGLKGKLSIIKGGAVVEYLEVR